MLPSIRFHLATGRTQVLFGPDAAAGRQKREFKGLGRSLVTMLSWVSGRH